MKPTQSRVLAGLTLVALLAVTAGFTFLGNLQQDPEAFKVTSLSAPTGGSQITRFRITGNENPADAIFENVDVGIGVAAPAQKPDVAGTVQMTGFKLPTGAGSGKVLTSDAAGVGSWQAPPAGGGGSAIIHRGASSVSNTTAARFLYPGYAAFGVTAFEIEMRVPRGGTIRNLYFKSRTNSFPAGTTVTVTLRKNGVDPALAVTVGGGVTEGEDTADTVTVAAGDKLSLKIQKSATSTGSMGDPVVTVEFAP